MHAQRKILHIDMDAFYASVEQRDFPELKGRPVIVGGRPNSRGVVAACSYEARKYGVRSAMPSHRAAQLCKEAVFVKARFDVYRAVSAQIHAVFRRYTSAVEPLSLDEAYLDVTDAAKAVGSATQLAKLIKEQIKEATDLTASAGVSYNKFLAKIASDMDKPDGLYVIRPERAQQFIDELEVRKFYGVGRVTEEKMHQLGIFNGADLRKFSQLEMQTLFGKSGKYYFDIARAIDTRPVREYRERKSIGSETTFEQDQISKRVLWETLQGLARRVADTLADKERVARTVTLKVRYSDFELITRSKTVDGWVVDFKDVCDSLPELLRKTEAGKRSVRLVGVSVSKLQSRSIEIPEKKVSPKEKPQLGLF